MCVCVCVCACVCVWLCGSPLVDHELLDFLLGGAPSSSVCVGYAVTKKKKWTKRSSGLFAWWCAVWVGGCVYIININKKKGSFGILARWCGVFLCVCGYVCVCV